MGISKIFNAFDSYFYCDIDEPLYSEFDIYSRSSLPQVKVTDIEHVVGICIAQIKKAKLKKKFGCVNCLV
jgi:hypothetical protein